MNTPILTAALLASLGSFVAFSGSLQNSDAPLEFPQASPQGSVSQRVGMTDIEVVYGRPSMKGRKIFGGLEPYGNLWRAGANGATKVTFSDDVQFGGADVPAGSYVLFAIPGADEWTIVLSKNLRQSGTYAYDAADDLVRVQATPVKLATPVETLAIGFSDLTSTTANLYLEWETTRVPVEVEVNLVDQMVPRIEAAMAGDGERPYFSSAMFYYDNNLDLDKAAAWIGEAVKAQPNAFWISYRQGLILAKKGDKKGAIEAARGSLELASQASGALKDEYVRLNEALIARCK